MGKDEMQPFLFNDDMILYVEIPKDPEGFIYHPPITNEQV